MVQQEDEQTMTKDDSLKRYSNHLVLKEIGGHGQNLIKNSKVLIIGLGGLGSPVLQYSIGSGVGTIGLIDSDYRGEILIMLINHSKKDFEISRGMRIAQMVISKIEQFNLISVKELGITNRGTDGFGSTGS